MTGTPQTYAQFGEEAGAIMWSMHRHITQLSVNATICGNC